MKSYYVIGIHWMIIHVDRSIGIIVCSITVINLSLFISIFTFLRKGGCCYESHLQVVELVFTMCITKDDSLFLNIFYIPCILAKINIQGFILSIILSPFKLVIQKLGQHDRGNII